MQEIAAFIGIATTLAVGAASPGPSFIMVARTAVTTSRADGLGAAFGMGIGGLAFATAALLGLKGLLLAVPSLYLLLKAVGGLYLAYLGLRIWRGAKTAIDTAAMAADSGTSTVRRSLLLGLSTQLSNPKTAVVYASVFAVFLPAHTSPAFNFGLAGLVFLIEAGWYTLVALTLSSAKPRNVYLRCKTWIDRAAGGLMIALGLKLISSAGQHT
ncbi:MAG: LysE family translocator [Paludibacterium sp.]|uniref:LysE family translocator n=2 Tax=Paludibacterium sp. TaxID=1917523 RepID=UPI0025DF7F84|nr:LysE family translocator [Paludibacterium sp.]MBV8046203.1 LysE family translocator [Paludibacterium sp.]